MGAELLPSSIVKAVMALPKEFFDNVSIVFFGSEEEKKEKDKFPNTPHITYESCPDVVGMDENPLQAVREKKASSLHTGIRALKEGRIAAFISCANTGALVAVARNELDAQTGISKPALACIIPTKLGDVVMLDVGANVEASVDMLLQFATLGANYWQSIYGNKPRVALLNIGEEPLKGTQELKAAVKELPNSDLYTFVGNKEPYDVFTKQADVFVTNGFSGNLFIKTSQGLLRSLDIEYEESYAVLLGLNQLVIKCHGASSGQAIQKALKSLTSHL